MLKLLRFENPKDIMKANISYKRIVSVESEHLQHFENLIDLNCAENYIKLEWLTTLPSLQTLNISHNMISGLPLEVKNFRNLTTLNISFNYI
jgi:Leucine-rich repeat (LRR) protein